MILYRQFILGKRRMKNKIKKLVRSIKTGLKRYEDEIIAIVHAQGVLIR